MSRRLAVVGAALLVVALAACGSSDSRDRNVGATALCAQGGPCAVGEVGPGGGIVFMGADAPGVDMWEAAPVNGFGTLQDARDLIRTFDFGGFVNWQLPDLAIADAMWKEADVFACNDETDCATAFAPDVYWTSDGVDGGAATKSFIDGSDSADAVTATYYFRPVRQFRMADDAAVPVLPTAPNVTVEGVDTTTTTSVVDDTTTTSVLDATTTSVDEATTTSTSESSSTTAVESTTTSSISTESTTTVAGPAKTCADGGDCKAGDRGPAGGTVVQVDGVDGGAVSLVEVAPITWFGTGPQAVAYAENLVYGGRDDWKLPTAAELLAMRASRALFACAKGTLCTNGFANAPYWLGDGTGATGIVDFAGKSDAAAPLPNTNYRLRPVRKIASADAAATSPDVTLVASLDPQA